MPANPAVVAYTDAVNAQFDIIDPAIDGLVDDVAFLKETIEALNNRPPGFGPEDQALVDAALARLVGMGARVTALDSATSRPTPPPPPTT